MVKEALIDCSSGKVVRLSLDGKKVDGVIRIGGINRSNNGAKEIQITILANDLKIKTCNGEIKKIHEF